MSDKTPLLLKNLSLDLLIKVLNFLAHSAHWHRVQMHR